jgi:putative ABC transport system permease protein
MSVIGRLLIRLKAVFTKAQLEDGLAEELRFHLEREIEKNIAAGMTSEEARYAALRSFGGADQVKEACRDAWGIGFIERTWQDVCYGLRLLAKSPMLVLVATLSLGLGVGSNLTVYSLLKSVLLEGPTARDPERLLDVNLGLHYQVSYPNYRDIQESRVFDGLAAYVAGLGSGMSWRQGGETKTLICQIVSGNFFEVLGVHAGLGRTFTAEEARAERDPQLAVLSYGFWQRELGGDPGIIGRVLNLNGVPYTVLGILPKGYRSILGHGIAPAAYLPISRQVVHALNDRGMTDFNLIGRLRDGTTREQVQAALLGVAKHLEQSYPNENRQLGQLRRIFALSGLERFKQDPDAAPMLIFSSLLQALVALVLLIACANIPACC